MKSQDAPRRRDTQPAVDALPRARAKRAHGRRPRRPGRATRPPCGGLMASREHGCLLRRQMPTTHHRHACALRCSAGPPTHVIPRYHLVKASARRPLIVSQVSDAAPITAVRCAGPQMPPRARRARFNAAARRTGVPAALCFARGGRPGRSGQHKGEPPQRQPRAPRRRAAGPHTGSPVCAAAACPMRIASHRTPGAQLRSWGPVARRFAARDLQLPLRCAVERQGEGAIGHWACACAGKLAP